MSTRSSKPTDGDDAMTDEIAAMSYEEAIDHVESIIRRIEEGEIGLEDSLSQYERGMALLKRCRAILGRVDQRITELSEADLDGAGADAGSDEEPPF